VSDPVSLSVATAVLLSDGWHVLAPGSLGAVIDPAFTDPQTGALITPGDVWVQFTDSAAQTYACPMRAVLAVKLGAPVTSGAPEAAHPGSP
jgi:hypothetical protein